MSEKDQERMLEEIQQKVEHMDRMLFQPSADGQPPMMERLSSVVVAAERGSWGAKWLLRALVVIGSIMGAIAAIKSGLTSWIPR